MEECDGIRSITPIVWQTFCKSWFFKGLSKSSLSISILNGDSAGNDDVLVKVKYFIRPNLDRTD